MLLLALPVTAREIRSRTDLEAFKAERTARIPLGRRSDPEEMAQVVVWLATEAPDYMTAARLNVTGGLDKDLRPQGREFSQREKANPLHRHAFYFCAIGPTLFRIPQGGVK